MKIFRIKTMMNNFCHQKHNFLNRDIIFEYISKYIRNRFNVAARDFFLIKKTQVL